MAEEVWEEEFDYEMDAETFILQYELDEDAAAALRSSPEEVVQSVISQGPPTGENPSALVMGRLRQVSADSVQDFDTFISMVDQKAKEAFAAQSEELIQAVMEEGPLIGVNPSAILMARIRKAGGTLVPGRRVAKSNVNNGLAKALGGGVVRGGRQPRAQATEASNFAVPQNLALQGLGVSLCKLNSDMWNFDVPGAMLIATFKNVLKTREGAVAGVRKTHVAAVPAAVAAVRDSHMAVLPTVSEEWPEWPEASAEDTSSEPKKKKARQAGHAAVTSHQQAMDVSLSEEDREQRREAVLAEVVQMLQDAGGSMRLQDIGSKHLTDLRKGAVANLSKFLSSRPDMVTLSNEDNGGKLGPTVSLAA